MGSYPGKPPGNAVNFKSLRGRLNAKASRGINLQARQVERLNRLGLQSDPVSVTVSRITQIRSGRVVLALDIAALVCAVLDRRAFGFRFRVPRLRFGQTPAPVLVPGGGGYNAEMGLRLCFVDVVTLT